MTPQLVADVMTTPMLTLDLETPVSEAASGMLEAGIKSVIVVGTDCRPEGIFTSTDALHVLAADEPASEATVGAYMTTPVETVNLETPLSTAAEQMAGDGFSHLPVVDADGNGRGILTTTDLAEALPGDSRGC